MGHRCRWEGHTLRWEAFGDKPTLTNPDGHFVELVNIANIPYVLELVAESDATPEYHAQVADKRSGVVFR